MYYVCVMWGKRYVGRQDIVFFLKFGAKTKSLETTSSEIFSVFYLIRDTWLSLYLVEYMINTFSRYLNYMHSVFFTHYHI